MRRTVTSIVILLLALMAACGQKGALFLPGDPSQIQSDPLTEDVLQETNDDETDNDEEESAHDPQ